MHFSKDLLRQLGPEYEHLSTGYKYKPPPRPRRRPRRVNYEHLSPDYEYELYSWFWVSETDILKKSSPDAPFPSKRGKRPVFSSKRGKRPVILATRFGPGATLYPRSASGRSGFRHQAHRHVPDEWSCRIDKDGWVVLGVPVTVDSSLLNKISFSCIEPDGTGLLEAIRKAIEAKPS